MARVAAWKPCWCLYARLVKTEPKCVNRESWSCASRVSNGLLRRVAENLREAIRCAPHGALATAVIRAACSLIMLVRFTPQTIFLGMHE